MTAAPAPTAPPTTTAPAAADRVLSRIAGLLAPYKAKMALVAVAVVSAAVLTSVAPFLTRAVFDDALFPVDGGAAEGAHLTTHEGVDSIHVTGSERLLAKAGGARDGLGGPGQPVRALSRDFAD